jgi:hypothetical protein
MAQTAPLSIHNQPGASPRSRNRSVARLVFHPGPPERPQANCLRSRKGGVGVRQTLEYALDAFELRWLKGENPERGVAIW